MTNLETEDRIAQNLQAGQRVIAEANEAEKIREQQEIAQLQEAKAARRNALWIAALGGAADVAEGAVGVSNIVGQHKADQELLDSINSAPGAEAGIDPQTASMFMDILSAYGL